MSFAMSDLSSSSSSSSSATTMHTLEDARGVLGQLGTDLRLADFPAFQSFSPHGIFQLARATAFLPGVLITVYMSGIHLGERYMGAKAPSSAIADKKSKAREALLRRVLFAWNMALTLFSVLGAVHTAPALFQRLLPSLAMHDALDFSTLGRTFKSTVCGDPRGELVPMCPAGCGNQTGAGFEALLCYQPCSEGQQPVHHEWAGGWALGSSGAWVFLFVASKVVLLVDTAFLVLRRKPVIFLHWFHHAITLIYCWHAYMTVAGDGLWFTVLNLLEHVVLYGSFTWTLFGPVPYPFLVTAMQVLVMAAGTALCVLGLIFKLEDSSCHNTVFHLLLGLFMFGTYFLLFLKFAMQRFGLPLLARRFRASASASASACSNAACSLDSVAGDADRARVEKLCSSPVLARTTVAADAAAAAPLPAPMSLPVHDCMRQTLMTPTRPRTRHSVAFLLDGGDGGDGGEDAPPPALSLAVRLDGALASSSSRSSE